MPNTFSDQSIVDILTLYDTWAQKLHFRSRTDEDIFLQAATAPTIIYVCTEFVYPKGFNVVINPSNYATWSKTSDPNRIQINHVTTIPDYSVIEVLIVPM